MSSIISCKNLSKSFTDAGKNLLILSDINFSIDVNEMVAILGVSGSGKSTFLQLLGGLDQVSAGQVYWNNQPISELSEKHLCHLRNQHLGFIYQFHHLLPEFTALENTAMPLLIRGCSIHEAKERALVILKRVGLANRVEHKSGELSGGERQRVAIARALIAEPACILADEPTGNLDPKTAEHIMNLMLELQSELKTSFVIVTHDSKFAEKIQKVYYLEQGYLK